MGALMLTEEDLEKIGRYVKKNIGSWIEEDPGLPSAAAIHLSEKMVRLEEAIKNQGDLMEKMIHQLDKRFEQVDKRFEQVDKRFEDMQHYMDKRFNQLQWSMGLGFTIIAGLMGIFNFF